MSQEDKLEHIRAEFNDPPKNVPGGDKNKALNIAQRCLDAGLELKKLQYTYAGRLRDPKKFILSTNQGETIAERVVKKKKNKDAYARMGYVFEKIGIQLRGNERALIRKHRKDKNEFRGF